MKLLTCLAVGLGAVACDPCPEGYTPAGPDSCARFVPGPQMLRARRGHTATRLLDGRVLFLGGDHDSALAVGDPNDSPFTAEIYDPASDAFIDAAHPRRGRSQHAALLLADGRVFVSGGDQHDEQEDSGRPCEIYDPVADTWVDAPPHGEPFAQHALVETPAGRLVALNNLRTEVLEPGGSAWVSAPQKPTRRPQYTAVLLQDGRLATIGGYPPSSIVEIFDPERLLWQAAAPMLVGRYGVTTAVLPDGRVLAVGGQTEGWHTYGPNELYDPDADRWSVLPTAHRPREELAAAVLADGQVLLTGGRRDWAPVDDVEIYFPDRGELTETEPLGARRAVHSTVPLDDGRALIAGGTVDDQGGSDDLATELFVQR